VKRVGRLFWKFFFACWFALVVAAVGAAAAVAWQLYGVADQPSEAPGVSAQPHVHHGLPAPPPPKDAPSEADGFFPWPWLHIIAGTLASVLVSALLAWYMARPVRWLRQAFQAAAAGDLETRVAARMGRRRDEIADLGRDFDVMAERLHRLIIAQRRLLHDVSHELRSPLARLAAAVGLLRQDPGELERSLARIEREVSRLDSLVGEVLTLARLDSGTVQGAVSFNLSDVVADVLEDATFEAKTLGKQVTVDAIDDVAIPGHADLVARAVENVVRNAIKYTNADTAVHVALRSDAASDMALLSVTDRGPGVPDSEIQAMFEPFFRASGATDAQGFGLGLAIAKRAVDVHHGRIYAENALGGGLRVMMELPLRGTDRSAQA
jgi:two-component system, OmpR family, sensor kinase